MDFAGLLLFVLLRLPVVSADCNSLPAVPDATANITTLPPYVSGTVAHFECASTHNPIGSSKDYICSESAWVQGDMRCEERFCNYVPPPDNGQIVNTQTRQIGSAIIFQCNTGYTLTGPTKMICRMDGEWMPISPPVCQIVMCPELGTIDHAAIFQDNSYTVRNGYGSVTQITCNRGYIISGSPTVRCQADGTWEPKPTCLVSECPPYPGLNSSCIQTTKLALNNKYFFITCREGEDVSVTKVGPSYSECKDQKWELTAGIMNCFCDCKMKVNPKVSMHNLNSNGFLKHGETLSWSCADNWIKETEQQIVCVDGKSNTPSCKSPTSATAAPVTGPDNSTLVSQVPPTRPPNPLMVIIIPCVGVLVAVLLILTGVLCYRKKLVNKICSQKIRSKPDHKHGKCSNEEKSELITKEQNSVRNEGGKTASKENGSRAEYKNVKCDEEKTELAKGEQTQVLYCKESDRRETTSKENGSKADYKNGKYEEEKADAVKGEQMPVLPCKTNDGGETISKENGSEDDYKMENM